MQITKKVKMTQPNDRRYVTKIFQHFYQKNLIIILHKCIISNECLVGLIVTLKCKEISLIANFCLFWCTKHINAV